MTTPSLPALGRPPYEHLIAETIAAPLALRAGLDHALVGLSLDLDRPTAALWRATEGHLLMQSPGASIEELVLLRDRIWYGDGADHAWPGGRPLHALLRSVAALRLDLVSGAARPRLMGSDREARARIGPGVAGRWAWRWLTFALPPDLIAAAGGQDISTIETVPPELDRALRDRGFHDAHVHWGMVPRFCLHWAALMGAAGTLPRDAFAAPGADFSEGRELATLVVRGAIARLVLAWFLGRRARGLTTEDLDGALAAHPTPLAAGLSGPLQDTLSRVLTALRTGQALSRPDFARESQLYRRLAGHADPTAFKSVEEVFGADPIVQHFGPSQVGATPEISYVRAAFDYLDACSPERGGRTYWPTDKTFARLFWQTIRIRVALYRHVVQRPLVPGLQWFIRFARRANPLQALLSPSVLAAEVVRGGGVAQGARAVEVRMGAPSNASLLRSRISALVTAAHQTDATRHHPPEVGVVIAFSRDRGESVRAGRPAGFARQTESHPRLRRGSSPVRYGRYFRQLRVQCMAVANALRHTPGLLTYIRGLDACTDELGIPLWVMAPALTRLREYAGALARQTQPPGAGEPAGLRMTFHVGEDFVHLLGGLRRVAEAVEFLDLREGDRLGHALALALDPARFCARSTRLPLTLEERLFDLLWVLRWYTEGFGRTLGHAPDLTALVTEATDLGSTLFDAPLTVAELQAFARALHDRQVLRDVMYPAHVDLFLDQASANAPPHEAARQRVARYVFSDALHRRGQQVLWCEPEEEWALLDALQAEVRAQVAHRGLVVEVNPSSNLLVGDLGDIKNHPMWRLCPVVPDPRLPPIAVALGSDDPLTFATTIREEFAQAYDALLRARIPHATAMDWLESARSRGLSSRFTLPESAGAPPPGAPGHPLGPGLGAIP